jgi:hypothetical protein
MLADIYGSLIFSSNVAWRFLESGPLQIVSSWIFWVIEEVLTHPSEHRHQHQHISGVFHLVSHLTQNRLGTFFSGFRKLPSVGAAL